jgi:hypothetical protein
VNTAIIVALQALACPTIHARPIPFGADRERLTLNYIRAHYDSTATSIVIHPEMIVVHWTSTRTFAEAYAEFEPTELLPSRSELEKAGPLNVSAHYMIVMGQSTACCQTRSWPDTSSVSIGWRWVLRTSADSHECR